MKSRSSDLFYDQTGMWNPLTALSRDVAATLRRAGRQVFYVGGSVRDGLLGVSVHDRDLTTDATPAELLRLFPDAIEVGAHFGVILIRRDGVEVQVATFRTETSYRNGRHPELVRFETDVQADLRRRDFTINALLEDPFSGAILDPLGGQADLRAGLIRAIGDPTERFAEDHLRMLRAVRFAARLGFRIEDATFAAIQSLAPQIQRISAERIRDELARILTEGGARRGFELLDASGLLIEVLPEVAAMKGVQQPPQFHPEGDVWVHTLGLLERMENPPLTLALACLLHDVGKPVTQTFEDRIRFNGHDRVGAAMTRRILSRLRFPTEVISAVEAMVDQHMRFKDAGKMGVSAFKRFVRQPGFDELLELHRLDLLASESPLNNHEAVRKRLASLPEEQLRPAPLLTGRDLIDLGYRPGPAMGEMLRAVEEQQLEEKLHTREEAIAYVRRVWAPAST
ncbi:CCA tRNA nucleotidyltransferase [uncultured Paludibaculum sp.]|uniref:CCA tRNA nucleotidyltransferase n=1 Tax=uncultured Paludibaculum sp. TaxID=1765020 RepID=UPI002AAB2A93|nr:CCA tRNA nucleotidyltransferase [uncultured Paludibaculum sp.]